MTWKFNPDLRGAALQDLMAAPGAPRCQDCGSDLVHPYDMHCLRCLDIAARKYTFQLEIYHHEILPDG